MMKDQRNICSDGPFDLELKVYGTDGTNVAQVAYNMAPGKVPDRETIDRAITEALAALRQSFPTGDCRLLTRREFVSMKMGITPDMHIGVSGPEQFADHTRWEPPAAAEEDIVNGEEATEGQPFDAVTAPEYVAHARKIVSRTTAVDSRTGEGVAETEDLIKLLKACGADPDTVLLLLTEGRETGHGDQVSWNQRCSPPWTQKVLRALIEEVFEG